MPQIEFEEPSPIFDDVGKPINFGWSRYPVFKYSPALIWAPRRLITESERYFIFSPTQLFVFEIYDGGLSGHIRTVAVHLLDKKIFVKTEKLTFPMGGLELPDDTEAESVRLKNRTALIEFIIMNKESKIIKVDIHDLKHHSPLRGEVVLTRPLTSQSMVSNSPWNNEKNCFQLLRCSPCYAVEGVMQFENTSVVFTDRNSFGIYESKRAVRPAQDLHYWACGCGFYEDRQIGFSIGYGLADSSFGTENAFFVQGKLHKLDVVTFKIPHSNWLLPWYFTSSNNRLEMTFTPVQFYTNKLYLLVYSYRIVQAFGFFSGKVVLDDGSVFNFKNITGFAERRKSTY
ncbi:MAG: DUF2804 domain-containing protein [Spirochaetaceae bacterium]|jgi:hypothetical protein|nr:DUF2804 domain-containing protein [Spirochaetaceae bacterium]